MQKRTFTGWLVHIGCFIANGLQFVMTVPQWLMTFVAAVWLMAVGFHLCICKEDIKRFWRKTINEKPDLAPEIKTPVPQYDPIVKIETEEEASSRAFSEIFSQKLFPAKRMVTLRDRNTGEVYERPLKTKDD